jgi:superfamily II DNA/RNA helicase
MPPLVPWRITVPFMASYCWLLVRVDIVTPFVTLTPPPRPTAVLWLQQPSSSPDVPSSRPRRRKPPRFVQTAIVSQQRPPLEQRQAPPRHEKPLLKQPLPPLPLLNRKQSIEDLEAKLSSRWGTLDPDHEDDDDDYELVSEVKDDEKEWKLDTPVRRRARPVRDPWQKNSSPVEIPPRPVVVDPDTKQQSLLKRVRRNQQKQAATAATVDSTVPNSRRHPAEYYDQDDEGYEAPPVPPGGRRRLNFNSLIQPQPVGGRGTFARPRQDAPPTTVQSPPSLGYFFRQPPLEAPTVPPSTEAATLTQPLKRRIERVSTSVPLLDPTSREPLFLTLAQAMNNFDATMPPVQDQLDEPNNNDAPPSWTQLGVTDGPLLDNLQRMRCSQPLSVQRRATPAILGTDDVLVGTYTGSGKTLAFLVPLVQKLLDQGSVSPEANSGVRVLIVAPGRELASQITSVARDVCRGTPLGVAMAIGGTTFSRNLAQLRQRRVDILVGTPGRLAELVVGRPQEKGRLKIQNLQALVMDEFDALLEYKPHREPTEALLQLLQKRRRNDLQTIMCSATASDVLDSPKLTRYLRPGFDVVWADQNDALVTPNRRGATAATATTRVSRTVLHGVVHVPHRRLALETLRRILHTDPIPQQILIFVENSRRVTIMIDKLQEMGIIAAPLHGGRGSEKLDRADVALSLREGYVGIVVATELAARGLDAPLLTHIINFDLPTDASHYAHRAGRCGRGGRPGVVINMTTNAQERHVPQKFADQLGVELYTVDVRNGKLNIVEPDSLILDR